MSIRNIIIAACLFLVLPITGKVKVITKTPQTEYAASRLKAIEGNFTISLIVSNAGERLRVGERSSGMAEGFTLMRKGKKISITGHDGSGVIYGANRLLELYRQDPSLKTLTSLTEVPQMQLRGACVGLQKTVYLPGHRVYEYP